MFKDVKAMNAAFGNPQGSPANLDWKRLNKQADNINDEYKELMEAIEAKDPIATRDAICDILVFTLGVSHLMGADAEADMLAVYKSNMSKFCKNESELASTEQKYKALGLEFYRQGLFPTVCLKSSRDQVCNQGKNYPQHKFLKGVAFQEPTFENPTA